jgi:hypothetical protein
MSYLGKPPPVNMLRITGRPEHAAQRRPWGYGDTLEVAQLPPAIRVRRAAYASASVPSSLHSGSPARAVTDFTRVRRQIPLHFDMSEPRRSDRKRTQTQFFAYNYLCLPHRQPRSASARFRVCAWARCGT